MLLKKPSKKQEKKDYYVSDFFQVLRKIQQHRKTEDKVQGHFRTQFEDNSPFAFLTSQILASFREILEVCASTNSDSAKRLGNDIARLWALSISLLTSETKNTSSHDAVSYIGDYLTYLLEMKSKFENSDRSVEWHTILLTELFSHLHNNEVLHACILEAIHDLDKGKLYVWDNLEWLKSNMQE